MTYLELLNDHSIQIAPPSHKHYSSQWINISCPFCGGSGYKLGYHKRKKYFKCYKCGFHRSNEVSNRLFNGTRIDFDADLTLGTGSMPKSMYGQPIELIWPSGCCESTKFHRDYLESRGFNAAEVTKKYNLRFTGEFGRQKRLDGSESDYKWRIVIPIQHLGKYVSFLGRDITERHRCKYLPCLSHNEAHPHKQTLFNAQNARDSIVIVEGTLDAIRLGDGAVATLGTSVTDQQIELLAGYTQRFVLFDPDATSAANALARKLSCFRGETEVVQLDTDCDPGDLDAIDAKAVMDALLG